eukprot:GHVR01119787.1.p1 GENE.GHVR01119787.1~~GHVR01119787.1.p1  ORF type:complete len:228 (-),score=96.26 GHVR01119787.1:402-1085(-)
MCYTELMQLYDDCLRVVLEYSCAASLGRLGSTCRTLHVFSRDDRVWVSRYTAAFGRPKMMSSMGRMSGTHTHLPIPGVDGVTDPICVGSHTHTHTHQTDTWRRCLLVSPSYVKLSWFSEYCRKNLTPAFRGRFTWYDNTSSFDPNDPVGLVEAVPGGDGVLFNVTTGGSFRLSSSDDIIHTHTHTHTHTHIIEMIVIIIMNRIIILNTHTHTHTHKHVHTHITILTV